MINRGDYPWGSVMREIERREVVYANCHRRRTYRRQGCYRIEYLAESAIATLDDNGGVGQW